MNAFERKINRLLFTGSSRMEMYETIALLLENGVILSKALRDIYVIESKNGKKKKEVRAVVLNEMMNGVAAGHSLSTILADWVPPQEVALIQAGEVSSKLPESLMECSKIIGAKQEIVGAIIGGVTYPTMIFVLIVVLLHQVATKMVPQFARVSPPESWTGAAAILNELSHFVINWGVLSLGVFMVFLAWVVWSMPNMHKPRLRIYLDKIPPWSIYRMLQGSTFLLNIAIMIKAGVRLQNILIMMAKTGSPWVRSRVGATLAGINSGLNLGQALYRTGYHFPDERMVQFLRSVSDQDGFDDHLVRFGERWLKKSVEQVKNASKVLLISGILTAGALMILVLVGVYGLQDSAQSALGM